MKYSNQHSQLRLSGPYYTNILSVLLFTTLMTLSTYVISGQPKTVTNKYGIEFVLIPAGSFQMGTTDQDRQIALTEMKLQNLKKHDMDNYLDEQISHQVTISNAFLLGRVEVTQQQWLKIMENRPGPEEYWQRPDWKTYQWSVSPGIWHNVLPSR